MASPGRRPYAGACAVRLRGGNFGGGGHKTLGSLFARKTFGELRRLHRGKAVWKLIEAYPERVSRIEVNAELPPDVDTPEDYEHALAHWRNVVA